MTADGALFPAPPRDVFPASRPGCYTIHPPHEPVAPIILSSPHSGSLYDADFLRASRLDPLTLRRSEDCYIDEIFGGGPLHGAALLAASFPRAWCDANRERWELDPQMFEDKLPHWVNTKSPRVAAGLGTLARIVSTGAAIYHGKLHFADAADRIAACWEPYHAALASLLAAASARFGQCILIDCHSMPAHACDGKRPTPDIVLGDVHGASCAPALTRHVEHFLMRRGYVIRRNDPYAGGYVTRAYGKPADGVHALQIEIARGLYMSETSLARHAGIDRLSADMAALIESVALDYPSLLDAA